MCQRKTGRPVPFEITEPTREALAAWLTARRLKAGDWLFPSRSRLGEHLTTRHYRRLVDRWVALIGLDPSASGTHSLRRTKVAPVYRPRGKGWSIMADMKVHGESLTSYGGRSEKTMRN